MSDQDERPDELPEEQQRQVAALLAAAPPEPMPTDVADRLQAVLRTEAQARAVEDVRPPVPLRPRRRRIVPVLAAAAVTVGVVAVGGTVLTDQLGGGGDEGSAGGSAAEAPSRSDARDESAPGTLAQPPAPEQKGTSGPSARQSPPRIDDLAAVPRSVLPRPLPTIGVVFVCTGEQLEDGAGLTRRIDLRGQPAWIVWKPRQDGGVVSALSCAGVADGRQPAEIETTTLR